MAGSWEEPHEPIEDGCPGGYQQSRLVYELLPFVRRRTRDGGRVPNPFFDQLKSAFVIAAVLYFEEQEDRALNYAELAREEARIARWKAAKG